jgi:hypothetical protein
MRTMAEVQFKVTEIVAARMRTGKTWRIAEINAVLCEDYCTVMMYVYFADEDAELISLDLPAPIDEASFNHFAFEDALMELQSPAVH